MTSIEPQQDLKPELNLRRNFAQSRNQQSKWWTLSSDWNPMLEITETAFGEALKEVLALGKLQERERIVHLLNNDAVMQTNIPIQWLTYIVEMIEDVQ
jgi:hypothetical protein